MATIKNTKAGFKSVSNDEIQGLFEEAFRDQVGSWNNIDEFEVNCQREINKDEFKVEVTVQGMAGCPTAEDFKKVKVKNAEKVTISRADKGTLEFRLLPKETVYLNSTEYIVVYQTV